MYIDMKFYRHKLFLTQIQMTQW